MTRATSLAAAIESAFDIKVTLIEGHNGIYEISVDRDIVYTNHGQCSSGFPDDAQIIEQLASLTGLTPKSSTASGLPSTSEQTLSRPLSMAKTSDSASDYGCCEPTANNSSEQRTSFIKGLLTGAIIMLALVLTGISIAKKTGWYEVLPHQSDVQITTILPVGNDSCTTTPIQDTLLVQLIGQQEAIFAILPCDHEEHTQELRDSISPVVQELKSQGKRTDILIVEPASPTYMRLVELHEAVSFPCLAVIGTGCASSLLSDDFSEERLFAAFVSATSSASSSSCSTPCGAQPSDSTSAAAPCCPK